MYNKMTEEKSYCYIRIVDIPRMENAIAKEFYEKGDEKFCFEITTDTLQVGREVLIKITTSRPKYLADLRQFLKVKDIDTYDILRKGEVT